MNQTAIQQAILKNESNLKKARTDAFLGLLNEGLTPAKGGKAVAYADLAEKRIGILVGTHQACAKVHCMIPPLTIACNPNGAPSIM